MPPTCPHCHAIRRADAQVPAWQCPSCSKAYAKASSSTPTRMSTSAARSASPSAATSLPWGKLVLGLAIAYGAWVSLHKTGGIGTDTISRASHFGGSPSVQQLSQLAASRQASDVLMYSAAWCPNCAAAKGWMGQDGFDSDQFLVALAK